MVGMTVVSHTGGHGKAGGLGVTQDRGQIYVGCHTLLTVVLKGTEYIPGQDPTLFQAT